MMVIFSILVLFANNSSDEAVLQGVSRCCRGGDGL